MGLVARALENECHRFDFHPDWSPTERAMFDFLLKAYASAADPYLYPAAARILLRPTCGANQSNTCLRSFPLASVFQRFLLYFGVFRACDHHEGFLSEILHQPGRTGRDGPGWTDRIWPGGGVASKSLKKKKRTRDEECDQSVSNGGQKFREP